MTQFTSKDSLLYNSLTNFYSINNNLEILLPIINQTSSISLRILDWLVTNYSKKHNVYYEIFKNGNRQIFSIYLSYKNQLKAYSKKYFDPFCRRDRITIELCNLNQDMTGTISTTIGQLNFFRWFIENKLLNYVVLNINNIDKDMNETLSNIKDKKKRKELSSNTIKNVNVINETFLISFD